MRKPDGAKRPLHDHDLTKQLQAAFDFFNKNLWEGELPPAVLTLQRKARMEGYYHSDAFVDREFGDSAASELAMNPDCFDQSDTKILAVLVHEMAHRSAERSTELTPKSHVEATGSNTTASQGAAATITRNGRMKCCASACTRSMSRSPRS